ncbi:MAG: DUF1549 domain-containing protein [Planctomycetaceae bacterium]|nr:DUF1549 domain-containing protein [Planctomycetaceae bacterium]
MLRSPWMPPSANKLKICCGWIYLFISLAVPQLVADDTRTRSFAHQIDSHIRAAAVGPLSPVCTDEEFARRIWLDLAGTVPPKEALTRFLTDTHTNKREQLIDKLLNSSEFIRHFAQHWDLTLLERRSDKYVPETDWEKFLIQSISANKPLDQMFRELLSPPDSGDEAVAAKFILNRDAEPNAVTREVGRMAFGMDLQCAQCHDHPLVSDYYQDDYYGIYAFVQRTAQFTDSKTKKVRLSEKPDGLTSFKSVFTGEGSDRFPPRLPMGATVWQEPEFEKGKEFEVAPQKNVPGIPRYSRREKLASLLSDNRMFQRNIANRLWAMMMGRGLVHPLDHHHSENPPSHPDLLTLLAAELKASNFDARSLLRSIARTRCYQRSVVAPNPDTINPSDIAARVESLKRQLAQMESDLPSLKATLADVNGALKASIAANEEIDAGLEELEKPIVAIRKQLTTDQSALESAKANHKLLSMQQKALQTAKSMLELGDDATLFADTSSTTAQQAQQTLEKAQATLSRQLKDCDLLVQSANLKMTEATDVVAATQEKLNEADAAYQARKQTRIGPDTLNHQEQQSVEAMASLQEHQFRIRQIHNAISICQAILNYTTEESTTPDEALARWLVITEQLTNNRQIAGLKALTPEQLAVSMMQSTGKLQSETQAVEAAVKKTPPTIKDDVPEPERNRIILTAINTGVINRLRPTSRQFVTYYGGLPGEDFQATAGQALFFGNSSIINEWLKPTSDNLTGRLATMSDDDDIAEELYLSVFSRHPTSEERLEIKSILAEHPDQRGKMLNEIIWAMLSSTEFRFNH